MGALAIDDKKYARVLAKVLPRVIATDAEHERLLAEVEKLMDKGDHRSAEEDAALDLMVRLIKSRGYVSDVINAKRAISKTHAKQLAGFFKVSTDVFI
jgi:HTH-type transcriptional regulator/antitoxin HigA